MWSTLPFGLFYLFPALTLAAVLRGGFWAWALPCLAFLILPLLDLVWDRLNPSRAEKLRVSPVGKWVAEALLHAFVPTQLLILAYIIWRLPNFITVNGLYSSDALGLTLSVGILTGGIGITLAHELVHRRESFSQWSGLVLLSSVLYGHFAVEHVLGHHTHVGTNGDAASARRGENLWRFVIRSVVMGFVSAWKIERQRLGRVERTNPKQAKWWSNRLLHAGLLSVLFFTLSILGGGALGGLFFVLQSFIAIFLLEAINYVEHYGLSRRTLENGKPEPVQVWHSWDSHSRLSSWILIHLTRHADHHKYPARPFYNLEGSKLSPLLPASYPACVILATVPPVWYRLIHPILDQLKFPGSQA